MYPRKLYDLSSVSYLFDTYSIIPPACVHTIVIVCTTGLILHFLWFKPESQNNNSARASLYRPVQTISHSKLPILNLSYFLSSLFTYSFSQALGAVLGSCKTFWSNRLPPFTNYQERMHFIMYTVGESPTLVSLKLFFTSLLEQLIFTRCH